MHRTCEFLGQDLVDRTLALYARLTGEGPGNDLHTEVGLAALAPAGMAVMLIGFVDDAQRFRLECHAQFAFDPICNLSHIIPPGNFSDPSVFAYRPRIQ